MAELYTIPHTKLALACMSDRDAIESALVTDSQKYIEDNVSIVNCMDIHLFVFPPSNLSLHLHVTDHGQNCNLANK